MLRFDLLWGIVIASLSLCPIISSATAQTLPDGSVPPTSSAHGEQTRLLEQAGVIGQRGAPQPGLPVRTGATPAIDESEFVVFGYLQNDSFIDQIRWDSITHIGTTFVDFLSDGSLQNPTSFTGRHSDLQAGGAAADAGVNVILLIRNDNFSEAVLDSVMQSGTNRTTLVSAVANLVTTDPYCQGVSFDFEFSWGTATRDGITAFLSEMRSTLPSQYEISVYTHAIYSSTRWDIAAIESDIDHMLYSTYDWATGLTPHAIADFNNDDNYVDDYLAAGLPPEKMVFVWAAYGRRWAGTTTYNVAGSSSQSMGWSDGQYETTSEPDFSGPYASTYVTGDEVEWYTFNDGGSDWTCTWDSPDSMGYKIRSVLSWVDIGGAFNGRRLGGVGFWSLWWMSPGNINLGGGIDGTPSYDPIAASATSRGRTYPHIYQLLQESLSPPGTQSYVFEGFEGLNTSWRDPNESPDNVNDGASSISLATAPAGAGAPASSTNALRLDFNLSGAGQILFRHEMLRSDDDTATNDPNATIVRVDETTGFRAFVHAGAAYSQTLRFALMDGDGEIEVSEPAFALSSGWQELTWDITDGSAVTGHTTTEPFFTTGDGALDSAGGGARDVSFVGFLIEGGAGSGTLHLDELSYEHRNPGGLDYVINEFRYDDPAGEFVEIHGPSGAFPAGLQVRLHDPSSTSGAVLASFSLTGSMPDDAGGFGHWVIGDTGVPNVDSTAGFTAGDDIPNTDPNSIQIYNTSTGGVYDSAVYEAWGGLDELIRAQTLGVTDEGWGWIGRVGPGESAAGVDHAFGRYPDGDDTDVNGDDFSAMLATPGTTNGGALTPPVTYDFTTAPTTAFQTFETFSVGASGVGPSPSLGNVHRCVDTTGGGVMTFFGDAALGAAGNGYNVEGEIYIPGGGEPAQAVAIGLCGSQGSTWFSNTTDSGAYEDGYWLIYENVAGVGLNDGRPDHAGVFEFVQASNDNMDGNPVDLLASASDGAVGVTPGTWTTFRLSIDPNGSSGQQLLAQINGNNVFLGDLPPGGPTSGAFMVGFRENHVGLPAANEGTWIDNLTINSDLTAVPVGISVFGRR